MEPIVLDLTKRTAIESLADRLQVTRSVLETTLRATAFKECKTNEEFVTCVIIANTYKLNPILKELYAFPAKGGGIIPIVSVDGWIKIANNHPDYDGVELIENRTEVGQVESITARFFRKSTTHPIVVTEYMIECRKDSDPWKKWPIRMLRHKAYIQGARIAFGFSGIYDEDEAERINQSIGSELKGKPVVAEPRAIGVTVPNEVPPTDPMLVHLANEKGKAAAKEMFGELTAEEKAEIEAKEAGL